MHLSHKSGALADFLSFLADYDINLKKIQSRPVPERPWEYSFYIDIEVPRDHPDIVEVLFAMDHELDRMRVLGWYKQTQVSL